MTPADHIRLSLFIVATAGMIAVSWRTLLNLHSHGLYRFIAWEAIAALIVWNLPAWFSDPLSPRQLLSWSLLCTSLYLLWGGVTRLRTAGHSERRTEQELYRFERTSELITSGIYHYIRHPMYASLLSLASGAYLKEIGWVSTILAVIATIGLWKAAKAEESECIEYFGNQYREYMKQSKMFVPFVV